MVSFNIRALIVFSILGVVWTSLSFVGAFTLQPAIIHANIRQTTGTILSSNSADDGDEQRQRDEANTTADDDDSQKGEFNWLEEWALEGKDAVALMKTQERTQRVMLAQMTEDRIYEITKVIDTLVDQVTGEITEENMPKVKELAMQTRNLQKEYKDLVTGAPSTLLETLANIKVPEDDDDKK